MFSWSWNWVGGFDVADRREARNLNVNHDEQRSKTEDENDDETSEVVRQRFSQTFIHNF
jgi:hypothetical protein